MNEEAAAAVIIFLNLFRSKQGMRGLALIVLYRDGNEKQIYEAVFPHISRGREGERKYTAIIN
jgi:hypothetical protein